MPARYTLTGKDDNGGWGRWTYSPTSWEIIAAARSSRTVAKAEIDSLIEAVNGIEKEFLGVEAQDVVPVTITVRDETDVVELLTASFYRGA